MFSKEQKIEKKLIAKMFYHLQRKKDRIVQPVNSLSNESVADHAIVSTIEALQKFLLVEYGYSYEDIREEIYRLNAEQEEKRPRTPQDEIMNLNLERMKLGIHAPINTK